MPPNTVQVHFQAALAEASYAPWERLNSDCDAQLYEALALIENQQTPFRKPYDEGKLQRGRALEGKKIFLENAERLRKFVCEDAEAGFRRDILRALGADSGTSVIAAVLSAIGCPQGASTITAVLLSRLIAKPLVGRACRIWRARLDEFEKREIASTPKTAQ